MKYKNLFIVIMLIVSGTLSYGTEKKREFKPYSFVKGLEKTDWSKTSIDLKQLYAGCPKKDCIPALTNPKFVKASDSKLNNDTSGIVVTNKGITKFYPFNLLVWHEIINDKIGDLNISVTFCPLCGTGIVFNRNVDDKLLTFGVSGTLYQSNLTMYDDKTESLWSQTLGQCIVGEMVNVELQLVEMQQMTLSELKKLHKNATVVSTDTGHNRNYSVYPYGNYESNDKIFFPVDDFSKQFPIKEHFYVLKYDKKSIAIRINSFEKGEYSKKIGNLTFKMVKTDSTVVVYDGKNKIVPGYYEMWFSWSANHKKNGIVWENN